MSKNIFKKRTWILILFFLILQLSISAQETKYVATVEKKIAEFENNLSLWVNIENAKNKYTLQERMAFYHVNGVSIAFIKDYKIQWARGFGLADSAEQRKVTPATLFQAAYISKSLNSIGVIKLVQEGKLNLSADINDYLKSWIFPYDSISKGKKISVAHLLSHTAGLTISGFPGYEVGVTLPTQRQILDGNKPANTRAVRSAFEPGLRYQYSGGGIMISQTIVEDITGQTYEAYMLENVMKPLGMNSSTFAETPEEGEALLRATAYWKNGKALKGKYHIYPEQAAAGLWTNPTDLAKYIIETQLTFQGKSNKVLTQEMTTLRLSPFVDSMAALGVMISKKGTQTYFGHSGSNTGFKSEFIGSLNEGNGVVVMINSDNSAIIPEIINSIATVYNWNNFYIPKIKKIVTVDSKILEKYLGDYTFNKQPITILREGEKLFVKQGEQIMNLNLTSETEFFLTETPNVDYLFLTDANKVVEALQIKRGNTIIKFAKKQ